MDLPRILQLSQQVVDRIAAGEVIQRPFSAVKELIENSVDAKGSEITVTVKGVSTMLQVQDNGHGIHVDDLNLICKRFNTSKLRQFEDLKAMQTYGFRGEALASMTHVARVTITTQRPNQGYSYRASYKDGGIVGKPTKCAGVPGTTITVEDLFYNAPNRLRSLKSPTEEYNKILDVVQKYSIHHSGKVGFTVKRAGAHSPDLHTLAASTMKENVGKIYGADVSRELIDLVCEPLEGEGEAEDVIFTSFRGVVTNPNYNRKKGEFLLFINGRLVECAALKRVVDQNYSECLPKGTHPFVYLSLELPFENVDVNVHPTKKEVQFLHEDEIVFALDRALRKVLQGGNESRSFDVIKLAASSSSKTDLKKFEDDEENETVKRVKTLTETFELADDDTKPDKAENDYNEDEKIDENADQGSGEEEDADSETEADDKQRVARKISSQIASLRETNSSNSKSRVKPRADNKLVRTDARAGPGMEKFIVRTDTSQESSQPNTQSSTRTASYVLVNEILDDAPLIVEGSDALELDSIKGLQAEVESQKSFAMTESLKRGVFVGVIDQTFSLIQSETSLLAIDHTKLLRELFYQRCLQLFGRFRKISLQPPPSVLALLGDDQDAFTKLMDHAELLYEYFGIDMREDGNLKSLPKLVLDYVPQPWAIPSLVRNLVKKVGWDDEKACFRDICRQIAGTYAELPNFRPLITSAPQSTLNVHLGDKQSLQYLMKNVLIPAVKAHLTAPSEFVDPRNRVIVPLAKLEQLYRIFERC